MKKLTQVALIGAAIFGSGNALANEMYFDLGSNGYDYTGGSHTADADSTTANFNLLGFTDFLATSVYDMTDGTIEGSFFDTNITSELTGLGVPTSGTAMDGSSSVNLVMPNCGGGQCDIDALSPITPPLSGDNEGYLFTWDIQVEYHLEGNLDAVTGPSYHGGTMEFFFNDFNDDSNDRKILTAEVTGSALDVANLSVFFDISFAEAGFLWVDNGSGAFIDASTVTGSSDPVTFALDTNVFPAIPTADALLVVGDNAIRQSSLDGSISAKVPEPSSIALLGLGLLGFSVVSRKKSI